MAQILTSAPTNGQPRTGVLEPSLPAALPVPAIALAPAILTPERAAAIVAAWREDPIDTFRKEHRRRDRIFPRKERPAHLRLAGETVERVARRLLALGHRVRATTGRAAWDLTIDDCLRIEVKASLWHLQERKEGYRRRGRYQANIRARQEAAADLIIFVAVNGTDHHFIIPAGELRGRRCLTIRTYNPEHYTGCLAEYREAWHLIGPALATARQQRPYQLSLPQFSDPQGWGESEQE